MNIAESIRIALRSLWANKLRSVLTLLGVVIGVGAVIAVVTFVSGINDYVAKKIFNLGADVFIVSKMSAVETNVDHFLEAEKRKNLDMEDYQAVRRCLPALPVRRRADAGHRQGEAQRAINQRHERFRASRPRLPRSSILT